MNRWTVNKSVYKISLITTKLCILKLNAFTRYWSNHYIYIFWENILTKNIDYYLHFTCFISYVWNFSINCNHGKLRVISFWWAVNFLINVLIDMWVERGKINEFQSRGTLATILLSDHACVYIPNDMVIAKRNVEE